MEELFELRLEVPVIAPDNYTTVSSHLKEAISEAAIASGLERVIEKGKLAPTFEQRLPTKEEVELILAVVAFAIREAPKAWPYLKAFLEQLRTRLRKVTQKEIKAKINIAGKELIVKGLTSDDSIEFITEKYEVHFRPHSQG